MTRFAALLLTALLPVPAVAVVQHGGHSGPGHATASIRNAQGRMVGEVAAWRDERIVKVRVTVRGFAPGTYGVHLHQTGRCDAPDFTTAGPHWNPAGRQHGRQNPQGPHAGDLPNLEVRANGAGRLDFEVPAPAGTAAGANPLLDADGTSIVLHAAADDERTDPSGNSGARIACGVLTSVR